MNVLLDTNVLLSAVMAPESELTPLSRLFSETMQRRGVLLVPQEAWDEFERNLFTKPWFIRRIPASTRQAILTRMRAICTVIPALSYAPPPRCRDHRDDYLLEQSFVANADYLVTGDRDVLALADRAWPFRIVTPTQFLAEIEGD